MPPKRPIRNVFGNDEDDASTSYHTQGGTPPKKPRSSATAPNHHASVPPATTPAASSITASQVGGGNSIQAQVAAAKARAQALMSAMQNKGTVPGGSTPVRPPPPATAASSISRFAPAGSTGSAAPPRAAPTASASNVSANASAAGTSSIQAQLEAARAKVQAQMAALNNKNRPLTSSSSIPASQSSSASSFKSSRTSSASTSTSTSTSASAPVMSSTKAPTGIHPLLLSKELPYRPTETNGKTSSSAISSTYVKGRNNVPPETNPYLQASRGLAAEATSEGPKQRSMHKGFQFHKPGRHVREAEELRQEQQMEELKKRIEESARKAGLQDELGGDEKRLVKPPPPEIEWWDVNLLTSRSYDDVPDTDLDSMLARAKEGNGQILLYGTQSPIDHYIQHPIPIPAPSDKSTVLPRGLMLTKREQRKLRRQRRAAEHQDKQDRIKMGLLPPEPPKVKLSNLMRVLTSEAVSDPTKIEARVRREIAARKETHERQNAERKLTDEQRRQKVESKKEKEQEKGLYRHVYRVKHLISARHKFKVRRNALDHGLTGICIFHPAMALVVIEGSGKAVKAYKRLMTVRIDWTDPGTAEDQADDEEQDKGEDPNKVQPAGFKTLTTSQEDVDWASNCCELVFEGPISERKWEGRGFRARGVQTDQAARDALGEEMQGFWDVAKRAAQSQDDGF